MDVFVLLFKDDDIYGASQPINSKEADEMYQTAIDNGYQVIKLCLNQFFESADLIKKYMREVY